MVATARPVKGVAYGRIDPVAASVARPAGRRSGDHGRNSRRPPRRRPRRRDPPRPALHTADAVRNGHAQARLPLDLSCRAGRFELQLLTPLASACLSPQQGGRCSPSQRPLSANLLSLSIRVTAGRYTAGAVPRCPDSAVLARRHRDVPSRLSPEVRELQDLALRTAFRPGGSAPTLGKMRRVLLGIRPLELGGGAAGAIQPDDPVWREQVAAEDRATAGVETTTGDPGTIIAIVDTGSI